MKNNKKSIILLSGGLDSVVSLAVLKEEYNIDKALTFDYGQRSVTKEIEASIKISEYYGISHETIDLPWLKAITQTSLVNKEEQLPDLKTTELDNYEKTVDSAKNVWVPNRNGLFINIAGCYADSYGFTNIIFGANKEEGTTFPDNTQEFIDRINKAFEYSTLNKPVLVAPLINYTKKEIIEEGIKFNAPLNLIRSCYTNNGKHCGNCESCLRLKRALIEARQEKICKTLFTD